MPRFRTKTQQFPTFRSGRKEYLISEYGKTIYYQQGGGVLSQTEKRSRLHESHAIFRSGLDGSDFSRVNAPMRRDGTVHWSREARPRNVRIVPAQSSGGRRIGRLIRTLQKDEQRSSELANCMPVE